MFVPSLSSPTYSFLFFYFEAVSLICSNFIVIVTVFVLVWEDFKEQVSFTCILMFFFLIYFITFKLSL